MKVPMRECPCFKFPCLPRDRRGQSWGDDSIQNTVTLLDPGAVQDPKPRRSERTFGAFEPLALSLARPGLPRLEKPPELLQLCGPKRRTDLLAKRVSIAVGCVGQVVRYQHAN